MELNMGLDMYLFGDKSVSSQWEKDPVMEDGFVLGSKILDMGYWRKHANLHGFIVDTFAGGEDECQKIHLSEEDLHNIIVALENDALYDGAVNGFFFGRSYFPGEKDEYGSYEEQKAKDIDIFTRALEWLRKAAPASGEFGTDSYKSPEWRSVYYQASW
jgi:hypothetical protein